MTGLVTAVGTMVNPFIEYYADNLPERRLGVFGIWLVLCGFALLSETLLPCDCLLLLTGTRSGELVVIERTPSRHAIRRARSGFVCVTNDFQALDADVGVATSQLLATSCHRLVELLVGNERPHDAEACLGYLSDPGVRMQITVQQMVFRAATGQYWLRLPTVG